MFVTPMFMSPTSTMLLRGFDDNSEDHKGVSLVRNHVCVILACFVYLSFLGFTYSLPLYHATNLCECICH
jgi:hypothetical protein